jgi:hyaluronoglucosaminidase
LEVTNWSGALEGFYGAPFAPGDRLSFLTWLGDQGGLDYVYAPKGDPLLRDRWREPFPDLAFFTDLLAHASGAGVRLSVVMSPGLDWAGDDDIPALLAKLGALHDAGVDSLGVAFDDVPRGGEQLGRSHGRAVAAAVHALPGVRIAACPVDYAVRTATPYLRGFSSELPPHVDLFWTGPSIVSPTITAQDVATLSDELGGRRLVLADNVPVNDGPMSGVLHLGPYPVRDPQIPYITGGLLLNLMPMALASRIGVAAGLRWWSDPKGDREQQWRDIVADVPGLLPLARACRSWLTDPGPDTELWAWALAAADGDDRRFEDWLAAGCRDGLAEEWQLELAPWLATWELTAFGLSYALDVIRKGDLVEAAFGVAEARRRMRAPEQQLFGIRDAVYPVTVQDGDVVRPDRAGIVEGHWLVDEVCGRLLDRSYGGTP